MNVDNFYFSELREAVFLPAKCIKKTQISYRLGNTTLSYFYLGYMDMWKEWVAAGKARIEG